MFPLNVNVAAVAAPQPLVQLIGANLFDFALDPADAGVAYRLLSTGEEQIADGFGAAFVTIGTWLLQGAAADYECQFSAVLGDQTSPQIVNVWRAMNLGNEFGFTQTFVGTKTINGNIKIRRASDLVELANESLDLSLEVSV